jgi:hypothetical protein
MMGSKIHHGAAVSTMASTDNGKEPSRTSRKMWADGPGISPAWSKYLARLVANGLRSHPGRTGVSAKEVVEERRRVQRSALDDF